MLYEGLVCVRPPPSCRCPVVRKPGVLLIHRIVFGLSPGPERVTRVAGLSFVAVRQRICVERVGGGGQTGGRERALLSEVAAPLGR